MNTWKRTINKIKLLEYKKIYSQNCFKDWKIIWEIMQICRNFKNQTQNGKLKRKFFKKEDQSRRDNIWLIRVKRKRKYEEIIKNKKTFRTK